MSLSAAAIDQLMLAAGFPPSELKTGEGIAAAESGGNPLATNSNSNGTTDYGVWQINSVHSDLLASGDWKNPADNTRMAHSVWAAAGNSWSPWSTFNSGAYQGKTLSGTGTAGADVNGSGTAQGSSSGIGGALSGLTDSIKFITNPHSWLRIAYFLMGGLVAAVGMIMVMKSTSAKGAVKHITKHASTITKAVKSAN